jgi:peptide/nickel transport system permease protein
MSIHPVFLVTDLLLYLALGVFAFGMIRAMKSPIVAAKFKNIAESKIATITLIIFSFYFLIALLDSIHFQKINSQTHTLGPVQSVLDQVFKKRAFQLEKTYSSPFSVKGFVKEISLTGESRYPDLAFVKQEFKDGKTKNRYILSILFKTFCLTIFVSIFGAFVLSAFKKEKSIHFVIRRLKSLGSLTSAFLIFLLLSSYYLSLDYHILGTGKIGQDVFYYGLKSIRTGLMIGLLTTLFMLPFALILGTLAGLVGGKTDDVIQYIYITLSSVPGVLLIAAMVLSLQVFINTHQALFPTLIERSDARLLSLCFILGITSWTGLCRMLRAETLKLRELEYVEAAMALGASKFKILWTHILPNVMHLVVIAVVLDFSFLVLAEAVLSYIGVGVSPLTISWGNMINSARLELAREPVVWWPMLTAFSFMFVLVLSVNLLSDVVRDEFDPKLSQSE